MIKIGKQILSKVVGNTFCKDGQQLISELTEKSSLLWEREPNNKWDSNAIMIMNPNKKKIGYIPKELAADLTKMIDSGEIKLMEIHVNQITGGEHKNLGCNIIIDLS